MEVAFIGFGLIAGSIARALHERTVGPGERPRLVAWSPSGAGARAALVDGVLDDVAESPAHAVRTADLVVLAAPPQSVLALLDLLADRAVVQLPDGIVVTDVASTKGRIVERATALGLPFVGGHPMAGLETSGYAAARGDLFVDRPWVVVPSARLSATAGEETGGGHAALVEDLARRVGARPVRMEAAQHDAVVAAISHLPLVVAAALVEAVAGGPGVPGADDWPVARELAASGWRDMTRLARGDVAMAAGIATTNHAALTDRLRAVRVVLDAWIADLERPDGPDEAHLAARFRAARDRLEDGSS